MLGRLLLRQRLAGVAGLQEAAASCADAFNIASESLMNPSNSGGSHIPSPLWRVLVPPPAASQRRWLGTAAEDFDLIAPDQGLVRIEGLDETGFIVNDVQVEGSIMLSGDVFTLWRPQRMADVTLASLSLLRLLKPAPDLLVLGCGRTAQQLPPDLRRQLHQMGVRVDIMDTTNAVATFNVLNQEGRKVVGALLPQGSQE